MRNKNRIPSSAIALVIAGVVGVFTYSLINSSTAPAVVKYKEVEKKAPTELVLVAAEDLQVGKRLKEEDFAWREWPANLLNPSFIVKNGNEKVIDKLITGVARFPIAAGEPIVLSKVFITGDRSAMSGLLREGMRAMAVSISPENGAGGFIMPGDTVDIVFTATLDDKVPSDDKGKDIPPVAKYFALKQMQLLEAKKKALKEGKDASSPDTASSLKEVSADETQKEDKNRPSKKFYDTLGAEKDLIVADGNHFAEVLLENVRVLAIDKELQPEKNQGEKDKNKQVVQARTATLEVTPEQAKVLAWANSSGTMTLALRSLVENSVSKNENQMDVIPETQSSYAWDAQEIMKATTEEEVRTGSIDLIRSGQKSTVNTAAKRKEHPSSDTAKNGENL